MLRRARQDLSLRPELAAEGGSARSRAAVLGRKTEGPADRLEDAAILGGVAWTRVGQQDDLTVCPVQDGETVHVVAVAALAVHARTDLPPGDVCAADEDSEHLCGTLRPARRP